MAKALLNILKSRYMNMIVGIILIFCGIMEITETALEAFLHVEVGAHHGVIIFGLQQVLISITEIIEGAEKDCIALEG